MVAARWGKGINQTLRLQGFCKRKEMIGLRSTELEVTVGMRRAPIALALWQWQERTNS